MQNLITKIFVITLFLVYAERLYSRDALTLDKAVYESVYRTRTVKMGRLAYKKALLEHGIYKKEQLPSLSFNLSPMSFTHFQRLLQGYDTGGYHNVEEYTNTTSGELVLSQKIKATGGTLSIGSGLSFLHEFSSKVDNFSSMPMYLKYSQNLLGGRKSVRLQDSAQWLKYKAAQRQFCTSVSAEQQRVVELYLSAFTQKMEVDFYIQAVKTDSSLLNDAKHRHLLGKMTEYEYMELELQSLENMVALRKSKGELFKATHRVEVELQIVDFELAMPDVGKLPTYIQEGYVTELARRNSHKTASLASKIADKMFDLHETKRKNHPNASISVMYGLNQYGNTLRTAYLRPNQQQALSVTMSIPIFQFGISRDWIKIAQAEYEASLLEQEEAWNDIAQQAHEEVFDYNCDMLNLDLARKKAALASRQYAFAVAEFKVGKCTGTELASSYRNNLQAQRDVVSSTCKLYADYYKIRHLTLHDFFLDKDLMDIIPMN